MTVSNVLFEIGLEEMPARFLNDAQKQLETKTKQWLEELRLPYKQVKSYVTPRRLSIVITDLVKKQPDIEEEAKGPAKKIALDNEGNWSKAAIGFSKGQGQSAEDIYFKDVNGTEYAFVTKFIEGKSTTELLPSFKEVITSLTFPKNMRWSNLSIRFVRPIRWIVALNDEEVIPLEIAGVEASNTTFGHRFLGEKIEISDASDYENTLKNQYVIVDPGAREKLILSQIDDLKQKQNWDIIVDQDLLNEVRHLVEYPTVFFGTFSEDFLAIPEEVLITSMKEHQRYFPVRSVNGELLPFFVAVRNGDARFIENVAKGNEKVLKARLSDARFFYEEDQKQTIDANLNKLEKMVFQENLGTIAQKVERVVNISKKIAAHLKVDEQIEKNTIRTAEICKFDLVTNMVNEFTELQGIMGEKYARLFGENENVAKAINEHYMPRHSKDNLPSTTEGAIVSVADKIDTIIGCISVGIIPSGSQDPYALRRQALGILQIINVQKWNITLEDLFNLTLTIHASHNIRTRDEKEIRSDVAAFFKARAAFIMKDTNVEQDVVDAVLTSGIGNFSYAIQKAQLLAAKRQDNAFKEVQEALVRVLNLASKGEDLGVKEELFENEYEKNLYASYKQIIDEYEKAIANHLVQEPLNILGTLSKPIHDFFDHTMVMADDKKLKDNRLSLLNKIAALIHAFADLNKIQWKQQM
ncbi:glycine--tRNA ligase subunit beta [Aquibacillus koreensis]|uniref:Glycine--tRNA ligase beta subunit n=1 Tax=Aquibacillus koreensis TaxID=279446 RepID=A0A9X3WFS9_9BACI|nr:glycine--tRNA ligase subunit beta [Aquibacillus koreensis]MCT2537591.1 glycine--tRNA ligase subunit beta [Aquibacillus koreensis]MDC3419037.1 glycine--tRNA ligase subunit beta [Aquibacillus koreensis]